MHHRLVLLLLLFGCTADRGGLMRTDADIVDGSVVDVRVLEDADAALDADALLLDGDTSPPDDVDIPDASINCTTQPTVELLNISGDRFSNAQQDVVIQNPNTLALRADSYRLSAHFATGYKQALFNDGNIDAFDIGNALATPPDTLGFVEFGSNAERILEQLDLDTGDTVILESEVFLEQGTQLKYRRVAASVMEFQGRRYSLAGSGDTNAVVDVIGDAVPASDWYPVRVAILVTDSFSYLFRQSDTDERVPARTKKFVAGQHMMGWDRNYQYSATDRSDGERISVLPTEVRYGNGRPIHLGVTQDSDFTVQWNSRNVFVDQSELSITSDDHHRIFVDGVFVGYHETLNGSTISTETYALPRLRGEFDVTTQFAENGGAANISVRYPNAPWDRSAMQSRNRFGGFVQVMARRPMTTLSAGARQGVGFEDLFVPSLGGGVPPVEISAVEVSGVIETNRIADVTVRISIRDRAEYSFSAEDHSRPVDGMPNLHHVKVVLPASDVDGSGGRAWTVEWTNGSTEEMVLRTTGILAHLNGNPTPFAEQGFAETAFFPFPTNEVHTVTGLRVDQDLPFATNTGFEVCVQTVAGATVCRPRDQLAASPLTGVNVSIKTRLESTRRVQTPRVYNLAVDGFRCVD